ncbi:hypothetical protein GWA97_13695 [Flavobacterium sp. LaA7.5]|nr:hypothetical protein [Flavobacterium salilacus subsp. altitudinum]
MNNKLYILIFLIFVACQKEGDVKTEVYKEGNCISSNYGFFYTTKYGGLNYYIPDDKDRENLFGIKNIDSIVFTINSKKYIAKPLVSKPYSRERNNSDFSFSINKEDYKIIVDTIDNLHTLLIFSEKTNMEDLKEKGIIKSEYVEIGGNVSDYYGTDNGGTEYYYSKNGATTKPAIYTKEELKKIYPENPNPKLQNYEPK